MEVCQLQVPNHHYLGCTLRMSSSQSVVAARPEIHYVFGMRWDYRERACHLYLRAEGNSAVDSSMSDARSEGSAAAEGAWS